MPIFAEYNLSDAGSTTAQDSATGDGAQQGLYMNGAQSAGGQALLDGCDDMVKIFNDPLFQMDRGTLELTFTPLGDPMTEAQTVLSRDSVGDTPGGYHIDVMPDGSIRVAHETGSGTESFGTPAGFFVPGDTLNVTYSWDASGVGQLTVENTTQGTMFDQVVPEGLTMDLGHINQPWIIGAGQSASDPFTLNNIDQHFEGRVDYFAISDTVDNCDPGRDGIVTGTGGDDLIDTAYTGDNDGDVVDGGDNIFAGRGPDDDVVVAGDGDDTVRAGTGDDEVYGGNGDDLLFGGGGGDTLYGGDGNDTLNGGTGRDEADGGDGDDLIDTSGGLPLPDRGYPGLYPDDGNPTNDLDTVYGGAGNDTIRTGDDADLIYGGADNDNIDGGVDDDTLSGDAGDDTLVGGEGSDLIDGGQGDDMIYGGLSPAFPDSVNIPDATDLRPDNGRDTIDGGDGNDTIFGLDDDDQISGGAGDDLIDAGIDDDTVDGGAGNDTLTGGDGADALFGGDDRDTFLGGNPGDVVDGGEGGDDYDTLNLTGAGPVRILYDANPEDGTVEFLDADRNVTGTMTFTNIENVIPCFTPGTMIATPKGEVAVESLRPGDKIITRDNGIQEIAWTGAKLMDWQAFTANPHLKPILIRQGSLGNGLPERDMMVSPNHRVLVANDRTALYFDEHEVLVAAKHLVSGRGVHEVESIGTTYVHFMFEQHQVVLSNGAWTESFQPGDYTLKGMGNAQRNEIFELFPDLRHGEGLENYVAARRTLKRHEARLLMMK